MRTFYLVDPVDLDKYEDDKTVALLPRQRATEGDANLISSLCDDGLHMPVIDLDFAHDYVASSTPGHAHLYLNRPVTWEVFANLLDALLAADVIEPGFHKLSKLRGAAFVRKPGVLKAAKVTT